LARKPEAAFQLIVDLIGRARHLTRTLGNLALLDVYGRGARFLLDHAVDLDGRLAVPARVSQQEIARRVGASRETVSRILSDLRDGGYIAIEGEALVIRQRLPKRW
jgi:CRP/FNR family cyclic AMP-dependent transcriptional regulator